MWKPVDGQQYCGRILRRIVETTQVREGRGHLLLVTFNCGHSETRIRTTRSRVGKLSGCPVCR